MNIELTTEEAQIVKSLLILHVESYTVYAQHERRCICRFCRAMEDLGERHSGPYGSLSEKVGWEG
jgi:hypothetical protein